jgi:WD40 repeat protein
MKRTLKLRWPWLFAALLPVALFVLVKERQSWRPKTFIVTKNRGHIVKEVYNFAWSPNGKQISVLRASQQYILIDVKSRKVLAFTKKTFAEKTSSRLDRFHILSDETTYLYSPDGKVFAKLRVEERHPGWPDKQTGPSHGNVITQIQLYDRKTKRLLHDLWLASGQDYLHGGYEDIDTAQFLKGGKLFYALTSDGSGPKIRIWHIDSGKELQGIETRPSKSFGNETIISHDAGIAASYPRTILGAPGGKEIHLWNLKTGQLIRHLRNPDEVSHISFSPDNRTLAVGGKNGTLTLWRIK